MRWISVSEARLGVLIHRHRREITEEIVPMGAVDRVLLYRKGRLWTRATLFSRIGKRDRCELAADWRDDDA